MRELLTLPIAASSYSVIFGANAEILGNRCLMYLLILEVGLNGCDKFMFFLNTAGR